MKYTTIAIVLVLLGGCTARDLYEGASITRRQECERYVNEREREACLENARMTFAEYEELREEARRSD